MTTYLVGEMGLTTYLVGVGDGADDLPGWS